LLRSAPERTQVQDPAVPRKWKGTELDVHVARYIDLLLFPSQMDARTHRDVHPKEREKTGRILAWREREALREILEEAL